MQSLPEINTMLVDEVLGAIRANPQEWNQCSFAEQNGCQTTMCFAGWAAVLSGAEIMWGFGTESVGTALWCKTPEGEEVTIEAYAREQLGFTHREASKLFFCTYTKDVDELTDKVKEIINKR